jgi:hypothetical protein
MNFSHRAVTVARIKPSIMKATKIALWEPGISDNKRYFSVGLRSNLMIEPPEYSTKSKIFVVSGIGSNFFALKKLLVENGVIDTKCRWVFEQGHLVVLGSVLQKKELVSECLWLIYSLEERARKSGGYVHFILSYADVNHMNGDWRYLHPNYAEKMKSTSHPPAALFGANSELYRWLKTKNIIEKIGGSLFIHESVLPLVNISVSLYDVNSKIRLHFNNSRQELPTSAESIALHSTEQGIQEIIDSILSKFNVEAVITGVHAGHSPGVLFDGKIISIETDPADGEPKGMLITGRQFYYVKMSGKKMKIK